MSMKIPTWDEVFNLRKENKELKESLIITDFKNNKIPDLSIDEKIMIHTVYDYYYNNNNNNSHKKENKNIKELFKSIIGSDNFLNLKTGKKY